MSSTFGNVLHLSIFGQSHSPAIGCSLDGIPAGIAVDQEQLQAFLDRRAPGRDETATKRHEADAAHIIAGVVDGHTTGAPIAAIIENTNTRSNDYSELRCKPRPGHADFPARVKYHNMHDVAGGGHFSGRLTAPLCIAGGIALQALEARGIQVMAHVAQIGGISDLPMDDMVYREADRKAILTNDLPCIDAAAAGRGSENNDPYRIDAETGEIEVESNNAGGILGGISTGAPVMWRMAVKPTPSIGREQQTVDMDAMENAELSVHGRHDPCIVPRAVPVAEAAAALAIWDALLEDAGQL